MKYENISGQRFGRLVAIERDFSRKDRTYWICKCDCGRSVSTATINLKRGLTQSCGCLHKEQMSQRLLNDLTNKKFGKLTVLERAESRNGETFWKCRCECGNIKEVNASKLKNGHTRSCGCIIGSSQKKYAKTHGKSKTRIYRIYKKMKRRCYIKTEAYYFNYGGRGITVCDEWLGDKGFENFYNWAMNNGYTEKLSIDRIDNDMGYNPSNCRWATEKEQANNRRTNSYLTHNGETKTIAEWSDLTGISTGVLYYRKKHGWSDEKCLTTKVNH